MRTTVSLDPDTERIVRRRMTERQVDFKTTVRSMGSPTVNLGRALQLAGELEDEDVVRRMRRGA